MVLLEQLSNPSPEVKALFKLVDPHKECLTLRHLLDHKEN